MKFKIIETKDILYVNRKVKDELGIAIDYLDIKNITLPDHTTLPFYLYNIQDSFEENNVWNGITTDLSFLTEEYTSNILSYYDYFLAPNYYKMLPSQIQRDDLLKITFYAPNLETQRYYEEKAHESMVNILTRSSNSFINIIRFSLGLELFENNNDLYYALWRPMNSKTFPENYNLRKTERFNTLMRSYLLFDDNSITILKGTYASDQTLSPSEKTIIDAGYNKHLYDITGKQYLSTLLKRKIGLFLELKEKYGFGEFTDLDRAKLVLTYSPESLSSMAKKLNISYPTIKRYKANLGNLSNVPWKNIYKLSEIYKYYFKDESSFLI